jgi:dethiobiotin synthetase
MRGIFVTGTDTGVGKTIVAASLVCAVRQTEKVCYWKPIQTGIEQDDDTATVKSLARCAADEIFDCGFRLQRPLSPHLSARLAGVEITLEKVRRFRVVDERFWIVEGAGGVLVPLNERDLMCDLMKVFGLPVLVVARTQLGTINHTLLTLEALRSRHLMLCGVVMNGERNEENRKAIEHYGGVQTVAEMPVFEQLDFEVLNAWARDNIVVPQITSFRMR